MGNRPDTRAMYQAKSSIAEIQTSLGILSLRVKINDKQCLDTGQHDLSRRLHHRPSGCGDTLVVLRRSACHHLRVSEATSSIEILHRLASRWKNRCKEGLVTSCDDACVRLILPARSMIPQMKRPPLATALTAQRRDRQADLSKRTPNGVARAAPICANETSRGLAVTAANGWTTHQ